MNLRLLRIPALSAATLTALLLLSTGCSRVQGDWKTAQAADTIEAYGDFLHKHPDAAEATEARARIEQLGEDRDWQRASTADTRQAYAQFIALHPNSKWTQEARIRIENFALGPAPLPAAAVSAAPEEPPAVAASSTTSAATPAVATVAASTLPAKSPLAATQGAAVPPPKPTKPPVATAPTPGRVAAAPERAALAAHSGTRQTIQLGAFNSEAIAQDQWQKLTRRHAELAGLKPRTETVNRHGRNLYRLRTELPDSSTAVRTCAALQHSGDACIVVTSLR